MFDLTKLTIYLKSLKNYKKINILADKKSSQLKFQLVLKRKKT